MNRQDFDAIVVNVVSQTAELLIKKGNEYANDYDRLINFKRNADRLGASPLQVWAIYAFKHIDSIESYIKRLERARSMAQLDTQLSEPIEGRFLDSINYLILGIALIKELRDAEKTA